WRGFIIADLKTTDGAEEEVMFAAAAGANGVTCLGSAPTETLDLFCGFCAQRGIYSIIDLLGVENPLKNTLMPLTNKPDFVVIHKGRDEESNTRKMIRFKDISKIRSKYDVKVSVAGGLDPENVRSAYFNGADVAILNIVKQNEMYNGLSENSNFQLLVPSILKEVGY
ncbi:MAG: hypothetical protein GY870_03810, partial [archaeon]|nr:hypothetical protein [archaeon]